MATPIPALTRSSMEVLNVAIEDTNSEPHRIISKDEAKASGLTRYSTGKPCKRGHVGDRMTNGGSCVACHNLRRAGSQRVADSKRAWRTTNRQRCVEVKQQWRANNPGKVTEQNKRVWQRKKGKAQKTKPVSKSLKFSSAFDLIVLQKGRCAHCASYLDGKFHLDHIAPRAKGGPDTRKNFQLLCPPCNRSKSAKEPAAVAAERGLLI